MFRIDNSSAASSLPAPDPVGTPGYFTGGNPGTGDAPTTLPADFMNMIMMELYNVVLAAGIVPSKTTYTQVRDAIGLLALAALRNGAYAVDTGATNTLVATPTIPATALIAGMTASILVGHTNTGAMTLNWSALGAKPIVANGSAIGAGSLVAGSIYVFEYDATGGGEWELVSPQVSSSIPTATTSTAGIVALATAAETKAGTDTAKATTSADIAAAVQSLSYNYAVDAGSANALNATLTPVPASLAAAPFIVLKAAATNTGATTLVVNGSAATPVTQAGQPLPAGAIVAGHVYLMAYNGSGWEMLSLPTSTALLAANGYDFMPNGRVEQWGQYRVNASGEVNIPITFPKPMPNACLNLQLTPYNPSSDSGANPYFDIVSYNASGFVAFRQDPGGGSASIGGFDWRAVGY